VNLKSALLRHSTARSLKIKYNQTAGLSPAGRK
jgi:hypothetical protein